ncbi:hypothetical protein [Microbacterium sp. HMWF026]|uniref:hypothetical protein n=1 Tax=Microbacterium sp. HMWF026 TaxID=2056861 RepID=UPI0011B2408B|nr:hypothetical protein [Microbacterium sp. HMWF026]
MSDRLVSVEQQRDGRIFVITYSKTSDGHRIIDGTPLVVESAADAGALGDAVVTGLQRSTDGVLPARDLRQNPPDAAFLAWVGAPTYAAYAKGVRGVEVWAEGSSDLTLVEVTPKANGGASEGFTPMDDVEELRSPEPSRLGAAVQRALTLATA